MKKLSTPTLAGCAVRLAAPAKIFVHVRGYASSSKFELVGSKL